MRTGIPCADLAAGVTLRVARGLDDARSRSGSGFWSTDAGTCLPHAPEVFRYSL